jgi:hypothetical protein
VIERPRGGQQVSGVTKVDVKASHPSGIKYVMIFVDDLFAFMANRPPFSYDWDTRRVADGLHTLVARAQAATDAEANSSPVQVAVANTSEVKPEPAPGGIREVVMADVRPATTRAQPAPPTTTKAPSAPASAGWRSEPAASVASADWRTAAPAHVGAISQTSVPSPVIALASAAPQGRPSPALKGTVAHHETRAASGGPVSVGTGASAASGSLSTPKTVAARPGPAVPGVAKPRADAGVAVALAPVGRVQPMGPAIRTLPMATAAKPVRAVGFAPVVGGQPEIRPQMPEVKVPRAAPRPVPERKEPAIAAPRALEPRPAVEKPSGAIRLYYNGVPMQTDVEPVITAGISAGPFRHIMEHSGGQVSWHPDKQTVTASALAKDVTLTIGSRKAIVNDSVLMMDLAAFLEKGRAMVPLRFFRDAFDFTVEYDAATGRICIQR